MQYFIITGATKGLGSSFASLVMSESSTLFLIARNRNPDLEAAAQKKGCTLHFIEQDLTDIPPLEPMMADVFKKILVDDADGIFLINNAGMIDPIGPIQSNSVISIQQNINLNLTAPLVLTSLFINYSQDYYCNKRILNISSGAGRRPLGGWSSYCGSKAGMDLFSHAVAMEQSEEEFPVKISSLAPGIIDTGMQAVIRKSTKEQFSRIDDFIAFKKEGKLACADDAAKLILNYFLSDRYGSEAITDIREI